MYRNWFEHNGKIYYTGTVFVTKYMGKEVEAVFVCYNTDYSRYMFKVRERKVLMGEKIFFDSIISVTNKVNNNAHMPVVKRTKEMEIDGLFIGWVWYIFLMLLSVIFKDAIGLWILISVVFFNWRSKKIKEEGTYIEW